jgi:hypothetical protein
MERDSNQLMSHPKPKPDQAFRKTVWLQIYLPFIFILLLLAAAVAAVWVGGAGTYSGWADTALVILLIPALLIGVFVFVILAGFCYGVMYISGKIPGPAKRAQEITARMATESRRFANLAVRPLLAPKAAKTAVIETIRYLVSIFSKEG